MRSPSGGIAASTAVGPAHDMQSESASRGCGKDLHLLPATKCRAMRAAPDALVAQNQMKLLRAKVASGEPDYVRQEIAATLKRKIVVIPVRVGAWGSDAAVAASRRAA
jgi:hypothetical protein